MPSRGNFVTFWHFLGPLFPKEVQRWPAPVTSACSQLFLGELSSRPRRARGSPRISHSPRSLIPITSRCLIDCTRRLVPPSAEVARVTTRRPPRTPRPLAPRPPPPLKPPAMAEADDDKKWYSKPNKRESLWGLGGMAVRPATRPRRLFPEPARVREYRPSARGRFVPREFPRAFLASQRVVPLRAIRRSPPPSPASSTSSRGRRTRRWTRSDRARRERTARAPRREATHTASRDEGLKLRARRRAVSARGPSAAIRDGR